MGRLSRRLRTLAPVESVLAEHRVGPRSRPRSAIARTGVLVQRAQEQQRFDPPGLNGQHSLEGPDRVAELAQPGERDAQQVVGVGKARPEFERVKTPLSRRLEEDERR